MLNEENIELLIWEYIDGNLNQKDRTAVEEQIKINTRWSVVYNELMSVNSQLSSSSLLSDPPLRFTKNVMENIGTEQHTYTNKVYINPYIIRSIASIFIITISLAIVYSLYNANWSNISNPIHSKETTYYNLPKFNLNDILGESFLNVIICINVILILALLDSFLSKRHIHHS